MSACKHPHTKYLGEQETLIEEDYLKLYNCLNCGSTVVLKSNPKSVIANAITNRTQTLSKAV